MQYDIAARRAGDGIQMLLRRLAALVGGLALAAGCVGLATFVTGMWVFRGSLGWVVLGLLLCAVPGVAAVIGWGLVRAAAHLAPRLLDDITAFMRTPSA
ncbi:MAG: hypothetical protein RI900_3556, partial [Actinomycetota bacterium]